MQAAVRRVVRMRDACIACLRRPRSLGALLGFLTVFSPFVVVIVVFGLLASASTNHRDRIALALLVSANGSLDANSVNAVLVTRLPNGSPRADLQSLVDRLGGHCYQSRLATPAACTAAEAGDGCRAIPTEPFQCEVVIHAGFCMSNRLIISAQLHPDQTISNVAARPFFVAC